MDSVRAYVAFLVLAALAACGRSEKEVPPPASPDRGVSVVDSASGGRFVGRNACRPCHAELWSTFAHTGMGRSWSPMATAPVIEDWTERNTIEVPSTGLRYRMRRSGGKFLMRQSIADGHGGETAVDERELAWVVGSANHSRTYLIEQEGKLFQAPVCWQTQDPVWDLCPGYELDNRYFARDIGRTCVFCHNDRMELLPGEHNAFKEPLPDGIGCERCHGPGERHVAKWAGGATPTGEGDPTIVNPKRLPPDLRFQVCFSCHLGDANFTERVSLYQASLEDWRPGRPIDTAVIPFRYAEATHNEFGLSAQVDRLVLSRCYLESGGAIECLTCHNPHKTIFRDDRPADFFTSKCLGCHASQACKGAPAARRATLPPDNCVTCHMRTAEPDDQNHVRFTDHWIRARIDEPEKPRTRFDVEPYFPALFAKLGAADRAFYTARAISLRARVAPREARGGMWPLSETKFREAIDAGFPRAEARYFLGVALAEQGKRREADEAFVAAYAMDPSDYDIALARAQSLVRQNRLEDANEAFTKLARDHPKEVAPLAELARARVSSNDFAGALELYQRASALDCSNESIRRNAAQMLSALGRHPEAIAKAEEALRLDPEGPQTWGTYATLLARAGRAADAEVAIRRARELARAPKLRMSNVPPM